MSEFSVKSSGYLLQKSAYIVRLCVCISILRDVKIGVTEQILLDFRRHSGFFKSVGIGMSEYMRRYLANKKIFSKRFSTDCFSDFFTKKALRSRIGLNDVSKYSAVKASLAELKSQNSYFINDLTDFMRK